MSAPIGVYVHVPFCLRKCPYCDFYSLPFDKDLAARYTDAVIRAVETQPYGPVAADTLYFGGGTPVLLGPARLGRIVAACAAAFGLSGAEITLEANPAAVTKSELAELRRMGFNRISFGVQSLDDRELSALGRLHSAPEARRALLDAADAGFEDISADLMLAVPGQTGDSLAASIDGLAALPIRHLSAYLLKVEEGTAFGRRYGAAAINNAPAEEALPQETLPDEDETAQLYLEAVERLGRHGFLQYEISNFARAGRVSRHNRKYWRCEPYLGFGPAAHSFLRGRRFYIPRDLEAFLAASEPFRLAVDDGPGGDPEEALLLGLRLTEGVEPARLLEPEYARRMLQKAEALASHGLLTVDTGRIALTPVGFLLSNSIICALLEQEE